MTSDRTHLIFVYGTLKSSEVNHRHLFMKSSSGAQLIGLAQTKSKFPLIVTTPFNIPFLLYKPGTGHQITGELYRVDDATLAYIDWFEGRPHLYQRIKVSVTLLEETTESPAIVECWIYGLPKFKSSLLDLPLLVVYHDNHAGEHSGIRPYDIERDEPLDQYLFED